MLPSVMKVTLAVFLLGHAASAVRTTMGVASKSGSWHFEQEHFLHDDTNRSRDVAAPALSPSREGWRLDLLCFKIASEGCPIQIVPQFKIEVQCAEFNAGVGLSDVRDGVKLAAKVGLMAKFSTEGDSFESLRRNINCGGVCEKSLGKAFEIILRPETEEKIAGKLATDVSHVSAAMTSGAHMKLSVAAGTDVGVGAEVRCGWKDTDGYHMVGVGGEVAAGVKLGFTLFAGVHCSGHGFKVIVGLTNFNFEIEFMGPSACSG